MTPGIPQSDPEEIRRQRDALERLCAQTSEFVLPCCTTFNRHNPSFEGLPFLPTTSIVLWGGTVLHTLVLKANISALDSNLIDVSQPLHHQAATDQSSGRPAIAYDFPRLFADHFAPASLATPSVDRHPYGSHTSSRPSSSRAATEEDENSWLAKAASRNVAVADSNTTWEKVSGSWDGKLTWDFDFVMSGGSGRHAVSAA